MTEVQTRSETTGLHHHGSFDEAIQAAIKDPTIWKLSYESRTGQRIRLVRDSSTGLFKREDIPLGRARA